MQIQLTTHAVRSVIMYCKRSLSSCTIKELIIAHTSKQLPPQKNGRTIDTPVETKEDKKHADKKELLNHTIKRYNFHKWPQKPAEKRRERAETLYLFSEQVDRNVQSWLRNSRPNVETQCNLKVGSHDPISIQLTLEIFVCVMEFVGVHTIQFLRPIIS